MDRNFEYYKTAYELQLLVRNDLDILSNKYNDIFKINNNIYEYYSNKIIPTQIILYKHSDSLSLKLFCFENINGRKYTIVKYFKGITKFVNKKIAFVDFEKEIPEKLFPKYKKLMIDSIKYLMERDYKFNYKNISPEITKLLIFQ